MTDYLILSAIGTHSRMKENLFSDYSHPELGIKDYLEARLSGAPKLEVKTISYFMYDGEGFILSDLENSIEVIRLCSSNRNDTCPITVNSWNVKKDGEISEIVLANIQNGPLSAYSVLREYVCLPHAAVKNDELEYILTLYTIFELKRNKFKEDLFSEFASFLKMNEANYTELFHALKNRRKVNR